MLTDKENIFVVISPFGTEELPELNGCDYGTAWCNKNIRDCIYRLASEKKRLECDNSKLKEENKQLGKDLNEVWNERNELYEENKDLKEDRESHKITIPVEVKIRFVDGC